MDEQHSLSLYWLMVMLIVMHDTKPGIRKTNTAGGDSGTGGGHAVMSHSRPLHLGLRGRWRRWGDSVWRRMDRGQREGGAGDTMTWIEPNDQYDTQQTQACNSKTDGDSSLDEFDSPALFNNSATQKFPVDESLSDSCVYSERHFFFPLLPTRCQHLSSLNLLFSY